MDDEIRRADEQLVAAKGVLVIVEMARLAGAQPRELSAPQFKGCPKRSACSPELLMLVRTVRTSSAPQPAAVVRAPARRRRLRSRCATPPIDGALERLCTGDGRTDSIVRSAP